MDVTMKALVNFQRTVGNFECEHCGLSLCDPRLMIFHKKQQHKDMVSYFDRHMYSLPKNSCRPQKKRRNYGFFRIQTETEAFTRQRQEFDDYWRKGREKTDAKVERLFPGVKLKAQQAFEEFLQVSFGGNQNIFTINRTYFFIRT